MNKLNLIVIAAVLGLTGCATMEEHESSVPMSEVPASVLEAAQAAVEGIVLSEAEIETEDGQLVYEIEGTANGKEYSVEVTADGKVLEIEEEE